MGLVIRGFRGQPDSAETNQRTIGSPMNRGVIHHLLVICDLDVNVELNWACRDAARQFVKQVVLTLRLSYRVVEMLHARFGRNAIPTVP